MDLKFSTGRTIKRQQANDCNRNAAMTSLLAPLTLLRDRYPRFAQSHLAMLVSTSQRNHPMKGLERIDDAPIFYWIDERTSKGGAYRETKRGAHLGGKLSTHDVYEKFAH